MLLRRSISFVLCWLLLLPSMFALRTPPKPECCLRSGEHHCDMAAMADMQIDGDGDFVKALNPCPYQHATVKLHVNAPALATFRTDSAVIVSEAAIIWQRVQEFDSAVMEHSSRGPPAAQATRY
jgi:hypothetical protein